MSFLQEKQTRYFFVFILLFLAAAIGADFLAGEKQKNNVRELLLAHDRAFVSSLLEQGVSEAVIAEAVTNTKTSPEAMVFLNRLGLTGQTDTRFFPGIRDFEKTANRFITIKNMLLSAGLLAAVVLFSTWRERLYQKAIEAAAHYKNGDFSLQLPQLNCGTVYRLFTEINHMAAVLKSKQEAERQSKEFLKNTISDISHQLKTPLAALTMYHEIILGEPENTKAVAAFSQKSATALERMEGLIQSLLKITRLDAGGIMFRKELYPVEEVVSQAVKELAVRAIKEEKEICLSGDGKEMVFCDLQWTREAVSNIVKNALDHTAPQGRVSIQWERTPALVRIAVSDNGTGIAEEDLHHIFKRFYRSQNTMDTQGTGLGLPLAKAIVEGQGGILSVQSKEGEGSIFVLSFLTEL